MQYKTCTKCGEEKTLTSEYFYKAKSNTDGFHGSCKECMKKAARERWAVYYPENKDKLYETKKIYRKANEKKYKASTLLYRITNKEKLNEKNRDYYKKNKEKILERTSKYTQANKELHKKRVSSWAKRNRKKLAVAYQKRKSKSMSLPSTLTTEQWNKIKQHFNNSCAYCGMTEKEHQSLWNEQLHQEHFVALSKGGGYTHNNIIPSCKACNCSKQSKDFFDWYPTYEHYNEQRERFILEHLEYSLEGENEGIKRVIS